MSIAQIATQLMRSMDPERVGFITCRQFQDACGAVEGLDGMLCLECPI